MSRPRILLTNDDGIDADGLAALYEEMTAVGDVTVVAPTDNQSGVGRRRSTALVRESHPWGYALEGTPADCVAYALRGLDREFDLVVSGCNHGPNAGAYVLGRSGTYCAAEEAAFLGAPAMAVSGYHDTDFFTMPAEDYDFDRPARVGRQLAERVLDTDVFDDVDVLNVNAPVDVGNPAVRLTRPMDDYDLHVEHDVDLDDLPAHADREAVAAAEGDEVVALHDRMWPGAVGFENPFPDADEHRERYPVGTDRRALVDGEVSVSPLSVRHAVEHHDALEAIVAGMDVE